MRESTTIWLVCHGPLSCNSGHHVRALAIDVASRGFNVGICVPERSSADSDLPPAITLQTYDEALRQSPHACPSLIHLWTAREGMRLFYQELCRRFGENLPYIVHLEDNETLLLQQQMRLSADDITDVREGLRPLSVPNHLTHPLHGEQFIAGAAGVTALIDALVSHIPMATPTAVFWPGFDPIFAKRRPEAGDVIRRRFRIPDTCFLTTYTGNVHSSNVDEVRSLYVAVAIANRMGLPLKLIRTGIDYVPLTDHGSDELRAHAIELGMVARDELPNLVHAADILVQPGRVDVWNSFRVPSKLPDFLASGRPVMLPRVNLGTILTHGHNAIVLPEATAERIAASLLEWLPRRSRLVAIGAAGAMFAKDSLAWPRAGATVTALYDQHVAAERHSPSAMYNQLLLTQ